MKYFEWNEKKNEKLKGERNTSFEMIVSQFVEDSDKVF